MSRKPLVAPAGASSGWRQLRSAPPVDGQIAARCCCMVLLYLSWRALSSVDGPKEFAVCMLPTRTSRCCSLIVFRYLLMLVMGRLMTVDTLCFAAFADEVQLFVLICYLFIVGLLFVHCLSILHVVSLTDFVVLMPDVDQWRQSAPHQRQPDHHSVLRRAREVVGSGGSRYHRSYAQRARDARLASALAPPS